MRHSNRNRRRHAKRGLRADHHVRRLDHRPRRVADLEAEIVDRLVGDRCRDHGAAADLDADVRGGLALAELDDLALELVARAELHDGTLLGGYGTRARTAHAVAVSERGPSGAPDR